MDSTGESAMSDLRAQWDSVGYIVVRNLLDADRTRRLRGLTEEILTQWRASDPQTGATADADASCMRHLNHSAYFKNRSDDFAFLMGVVADPGILEISQTILGEPAMFRSTSFFMNPTKTSRDGDWHRDSQFLTGSDEAERQMIETCVGESFGFQLQIALVPSDDIEYVPGSHRRWDTPEEYTIRKADGGANNRSNAMPGALRVALAPGDAVAFTPMGHHRGRYHVDRLRRTFMLTYTPRSRPFRDWFSTQPWFLQAGYLDGLPRETKNFFDEFVETYRGDWADAPKPVTGN